jgi:hypothetical protein
MGVTKNVIDFNIIQSDLEKKSKNAKGFSCLLTLLRAETFAIFN